MAGTDFDDLSSAIGACGGRDAIKDAQPIGATVNNQAATFTLVYCADTDQQAQEEAEAGFMSYVRAQIASTGPVLEARKSGRSPEEIAADRPPLSLAQVYAGLAFYHSNKQEIDADIAAEEEAYDEGVRSSGLPLRP